MDQIQAGLTVTRAIADAIRELTFTSDLRGVPNGHLWAHVDGKISFETYNRILDILKRAKLIEERAHLLVWIGPR